MGRLRRKYGEPKEDYINRAIFEMYSQGYHISEIATKLNMTQFAVYNTLMIGSSKITTEEEREVMLELRGNGKTYRQIAAIVGRSASCVHDRINRPAKFNNRIGDHYLSDKNLKRMKEWYQAGKTITWIAKKLGVPRSSIIYRVKNAGIYERNKSNNTPISVLEGCKITTLLIKNMDVVDIANEIGRSPAMVARYIKSIKAETV